MRPRPLIEIGEDSLRREPSARHSGACVDHEDGGSAGVKASCGVGGYRHRQGVHWAHVVDDPGTELLSRKIDNDRVDLSELIAEVLFLAGEVVWVVDQPGSTAALLLALLW